MDMEMAKLAFQIGQFALTAGVGFYVYMSNKNKVTNDRITEMEKDIDTKLDDYGDRIARLEERSEHAPTHEDLGVIYEKMKALGTKLDTMSGEFGQVKNLLGIIHEYILNGAKK